MNVNLIVAVMQVMQRHATVVMERQCNKEIQ